MRYLLLIALTVLISLYGESSKAALPFTVQESNDLRHDGAKVWLNKSGSSTTVCGVLIENIEPGERIKLFAWTVTTNDTGQDIGVTHEVMTWDYTSSSWSNIRRTSTNSSSSQYGGGNLTPQVHHWPYLAHATFVAEKYEAKRFFSSIIYAYSTQPKGELTINECSLSAERWKP